MLSFLRFVSIDLAFTAVFMWIGFRLVRHFAEERRPHQYRVIVSFRDPERYQVQSRYRGLFGWSKWTGYGSERSLEEAEAAARAEEAERIRKLAGPVVVADLGGRP